MGSREPVTNRGEALRRVSTANQGYGNPHERSEQQQVFACFRAVYTYTVRVTAAPPPSRLVACPTTSHLERGSVPVAMPHPEPPSSHATNNSHASRSFFRAAELLSHVLCLRTASGNTPRNSGTICFPLRENLSWAHFVKVSLWVWELSRGPQLPPPATTQNIQ